MNTKEIYKKLQKYAATATELGDGQVVFANQSETVPPKPFITIDVRSFKQVGTVLKKELSIDEIEESTVLMKGVVSFQCFADKLFEAEEYLSELALKFNTELASEIFSGKLAKQKTLKEVTAIPNFRDNQLEYRAIYEIEVAFNQTVRQEVRVIEKVQLNGLINQQEIIKIEEINAIDR